MTNNTDCDHRGVIVKLLKKKQFGFIAFESGAAKEVFFHFSVLENNGLDAHSLQEGDAVYFRFETDGTTGRRSVTDMRLRSFESRKGLVKFFDSSKGFGFVDGGEKKDIFLHQSSFGRSPGNISGQDLTKGVPIAFRTVAGGKGTQVFEILKVG